MTVRRISGHEYAYSGGEWVMVQCECSITANVCPFPKTIRKGQMGGKRVKTTDNHYLSLTEIDMMNEYWESHK